MSLELPFVWKDYYVLVKGPELVARAAEIGWNNFLIFEKNEFTGEELEEIIRTHKNVVLFHPDPENQKNLYSYSRIRDLDQFIIRFNPCYGMYKSDGEKIKTFADILDCLPRILNYLEIRMLRDDISWCTDYKDRCGECGHELEAKDKYCKFCGTERGKGKFSPYKMSCMVVHGASRIKKKFRCSSCGSIWITVNDVSVFCPKCGRKTIEMIEERKWDRFGDVISVKDPYDTKTDPVIFSEDQVKCLLCEREEIEDRIRYFSIYDPLKILKAMRKIGIDIPDNWEQFEISDKQAEQINLSHTILFLKGNNIHAYGKEICPYCKSHLAAGIGYHIHNCTGEIFTPHSFFRDPIYYDDGECINQPDQSGTTGRPAFVCLQCGQVFGKFTLSKWQLRKYRETIRNTAEKDSKGGNS